MSQVGGITAQLRPLNGNTTLLAEPLGKSELKVVPPSVLTCTSAIYSLPIGITLAVTAQKIKPTDCPALLRSTRYRCASTSLATTCTPGIIARATHNPALPPLMLMLRFLPPPIWSLRYSTLTASRLLVGQATFAIRLLLTSTVSETFSLLS